MPGFGKREIGTPRVAELLRDALKSAQPSAAKAPASPRAEISTRRTFCGIVLPSGGGGVPRPIRSR